MKVTVSFELDLSVHPAFNVESVNDLAGSLENLSSFFAELHSSNLEKLTDAMSRKDLAPEMQAALIEQYKYDVAISKQLFDNYRVIGTTEDGHNFDTAHKPG